MKSRTVFIGCLAGLIANRLLFPVFTDFLPGYIGLAFTQQIPTQNVALLLCVLSALVILAGGYVAARLEWARTWQRAIPRGVHVGLLAGCLAYLFSGAGAAAGIFGQKEILLGLNAPIASESAGIGLLAQGVVNTAVWTQVMFWVIMVPSVLLGAFGGLLSLIEKSPGWMLEPAPKNPDLERLVVYSVGVFGVINLVILVAVMTLLPGVTQKAILENKTSTNGFLAPPSFILILPLITAVIGLIPSVILSIKWAIQAWGQPGERFKVKTWLWIIGVFALLLLLVNLYLALAVVGGSAIIIALAVWAFRQKGTSPQSSAGSFRPNTPLDYLASALTQGILCGTLTTVSMVAYSLSLVLIAIVDIPHLTLSGAVESTASEQILSLYTTLGSYNLAFPAIGSLIGLIVAGIGWAIGSLHSYRQKRVIAAEVSNLGDE